MQTGKKRLEYFDALKAFAILLVVLGHIPMYCYGQDVHGVSNYVGYFHMPLFFMISGFFVKNIDMTWKEIGHYLWRKAQQLIIPAFIIMIAYCVWKNINTADTIFYDKWRAGYWFTFTLWEFFAITAIVHKLSKGYGGGILLTLGLIFAIVFGTNAMDSLFHKIKYIDIINNSQLKFFLFFILGMFARKHKDTFDRLIESKTIVSTILILACMYAYLSDCIPSGIISIKIDFILYGIVGCFISYAFFKKHQEHFCENKWYGRTIQFVGKRTLNIYLLHYFFMPTNMQTLGLFLSIKHNPLIEFVLSSAISVIVISLSLLIGSILKMTLLFKR